MDSTDPHYKLLRTESSLILSLDVFYFFACYLTVRLSGQTVLQFTGLLPGGTGALAPAVLKYVVLGYAAVSLARRFAPAALYRRRLALGPGQGGTPPAGTVESACVHYRRVNRGVFAGLSFVNALAAAYFIAYGKLWLLALVSYAGFLFKIIIFPGAKSFSRRVLESVQR